MGIRRSTLRMSTWPIRDRSDGRSPEFTLRHKQQAAKSVSTGTARPRLVPLCVAEHDAGWKSSVAVEECSGKNAAIDVSLPRAWSPFAEVGRSVRLCRGTSNEGLRLMGRPVVQHITYVSDVSSAPYDIVHFRVLSIGFVTFGSTLREWPHKSRSSGIHIARREGHRRCQKLDTFMRTKRNQFRCMNGRSLTRILRRSC